MLFVCGKIKWFRFCSLFHLVPGCRERWKAQSDFCFRRVITNDSSIENGMKGYCHKNEGVLVHAVNRGSVRLVEQFLYTMELNSETNSSRCLVIGPTNASSYSILPVTQGPVFSSTTHTCAVRMSDKWQLQPCNASDCDQLCIASRGNT